MAKNANIAASAAPRARDGQDDLARGFALARRYQRQGKWREAEQLYASILAIDPSHFGSLCGLGAVCKQQEKREDAVALFRRAAAIAPDSADIRTGLGVIFTNLNCHEEAISCFKTALAANPDHAETHNHLGNAYQKLGRRQQAIWHHARALAINPDSAEAHCDLGAVFAALRRPDAAIARYRRALVLKPDSAEAHCRLGEALWALERRDEAVSHFERALTIRPGSAQAHCGLGILLGELIGPNAAIVHFEQALAAEPDLAEAHFRLGHALERLARHEEAMACYQKALAIGPDRTDAHHRLGVVLQALDRHEEAIGHYERVLTKRPDDVEVCLCVAIALQKLDRFEASITWCKRALVLDPSQARAHHAIGVALQALGHLSSASEAYAKAVALAPRGAVFHLNLAHSKPFTEGDPRLGALECLAMELESLEPDEQIALHFALGKAYADREQHAKAFHHWRAGNTLKRQRITYDEPGTLGLFERIAWTFTSDLIRQKSGGGDSSRLPVFVIGMPRSGTTLIEQILASHSGVLGAGEHDDFRKEVLSLTRSKGATRFLELLPTLTSEDLSRIGGRYVQRLKAYAPAAERIVDKMPSNFMFAGLIHLALPHARIIHARRDPIDTCLSCFSLLFSGEQPHLYDLGELGRYYRAYARLMEHWRRVLPPGVMMEVQYEDIVDNLETQARKILAHCGLEWQDACLAFDKTQRPVTTASAAQVRRPIYRHAVGRWRPYANQLQPLLQALDIPLSPVGTPSPMASPHG
jgi:tetratricopeptide (TPR) repeat protein